MFNAKKLARQTALATAIISSSISDEVNELFEDAQESGMPEHVNDMWANQFEDETVRPMTGSRVYHA